MTFSLENEIIINYTLNNVMYDDVYTTMKSVEYRIFNYS
jgi:hypothetical protein